MCQLSPAACSLCIPPRLSLQFAGFSTVFHSFLLSFSSSSCPLSPSPSLQQNTRPLSRSILATRNFSIVSPYHIPSPLLFSSLLFRFIVLFSPPSLICVSSFYLLLFPTDVLCSIDFTVPSLSPPSSRSTCHRSSSSSPLFISPPPLNKLLLGVYQLSRCAHVYVYMPCVNICCTPHTRGDLASSSLLLFSLFLSLIFFAMFFFFNFNSSLCVFIYFPCCTSIGISTFSVLCYASLSSLIFRSFYFLWILSKKILDFVLILHEIFIKERYNF